MRLIDDYIFPVCVCVCGCGCGVGVGVCVQVDIFRTDVHCARLPEPADW